LINEHKEVIMEQLKQAIMEKGVISGVDVLKVDSFLNHQIDPQLMNEIGLAFAERFADCGVTKVMTIETSGIAPAIFTGLHLGVPLLFAKKTKSITLDRRTYETKVLSFTKRKEYRIVVEQAYLTEADTVLLIDDFLAEGQALRGLIEIIEQAGATLCGAGIVIEKGFQHGGDRLREKGYRIESLAIIESMANHRIVFRD
jgi:xanthine phosphoribosyltransferase